MPFSARGECGFLWEMPDWAQKKRRPSGAAGAKNKRGGGNQNMAPADAGKLFETYLTEASSPAFIGAITGVSEDLSEGIISLDEKEYPTLGAEFLRRRRLCPGRGKSASRGIAAEKGGHKESRRQRHRAYGSQCARGKPSAGSARFAHEPAHHLGLQELVELCPLFGSRALAFFEAQEVFKGRLSVWHGQLI